MKTNRFICLLTLVFATSGCGRFWMPSETTIYELACDAIEESTGFLIGTRLHSIDKTSMYIGKSAGWIDIPCDLSSTMAAPPNPKYVVLMKRVARTWVVETIYPPGAKPEPFQPDAK